mgnify:CR=1 FL=1
MMDDLIPVIVVFIVFGSISFWTWLGHREKLAKSGAHANDVLADENQMLRDKTALLEKRVQVLESIVTDKKFQLNEEISALAD